MDSSNAMLSRITIFMILIISEKNVMFYCQATVVVDFRSAARASAKYCSLAEVDLSLVVMNVLFKNILIFNK